MRHLRLDACHGLAQAMLALLACLWLSSCLVDPDNLCGKHQIEAEGEFAGCRCDPERAYPNPVGRGCILCPAGQKPNATMTGCACPEGQVVDPAGACVAAPPPPEGGVESDGGAVDAGPSVDIENPPGLGSMCMTNAQCAQYPTAKYCSPLGACGVDGCDAPGRQCATGSKCCKSSGFAMARGMSVCVPMARLTNGACPLMGEEQPE